MSKKNSQTDYKTITDESKARIRKLDVVSPSTYAGIYSDIARACDLDLSDETTAVNEALDEKLASFSRMREQTSEHAAELNAKTARAVDAIEHHDDARLQAVLAETKALREEIESLKNAMYKDALTNVYNRKWFADNYLCVEGETFRVAGSLALIDMNDFKQINDTYGHVTGDKILAYAAAQFTRTGGHVIRYGGDEFFVLFTAETSTRNAMQKMHVIREAVIKKLFRVQEKTFRISFSLGLHAFGEGDTLACVIEAADVKMYQDKKAIKARLKAL